MGLPFVSLFDRKAARKRTAGGRAKQTMENKMKVGILALQGDFAKHAEKLRECNAEPVLVKTPEDLWKCRGLIIPGGESTTLVKLLNAIGLYEAIPEFSRQHPIFGTCAGAILVSKSVSNHSVASFGLLDIDVQRNAYGRQIDSFVDRVSLRFNGSPLEIEGVFIRAPKITRIGKDVRVLAKHRNDLVMVENDAILAATFHPELTPSPLVHQYFIDKISKF